MAPLGCRTDNAGAVLPRPDLKSIRLLTRHFLRLPNHNDRTQIFPALVRRGPREPIEKRKALLARLMRGSHLSIVLNEHFEEDGTNVYREACKLGCEGIVSKRLGSPYRSGRSSHWVKVKDPKAPAVRREAEDDWAR